MKPNDIQISDWITLIAAGIAALSAVVAAIFSAIAVFSTNRRLDLVRESDFRRKQLDEFYGPLVMLRLRSAKLREQLSPSKRVGDSLTISKISKQTPTLAGRRLSRRS